MCRSRLGTSHTCTTGVGNLFLKITARDQRGQVHPQLHDRLGNFWRNPDQHTAGAQQLGRLGCLQQMVSDCSVDHRHAGDVNDDPSGADLQHLRAVLTSAWLSQLNVMVTWYTFLRVLP